ncbi:unnamed protein product, partial [Coregonus sp. 'balchen']
QQQKLLPPPRQNQAEAAAQAEEDQAEPPVNVDNQEETPMEQEPAGEASPEKTPQETPEKGDQEEKVPEEHPKMPEHPGRDSKEEKQALTFSNNSNLPHLKTRMTSCGSCFWSIVWLVILLIIAWPISILLGGLYGLITPLTTCVGLDRLSDLLLEGANLGRTCAQNMRHSKAVC